jgi:hypothetical protein
MKEVGKSFIGSTRLVVCESCEKSFFTDARLSLPTFIYCSNCEPDATKQFTYVEDGQTHTSRRIDWDAIL